MNPTIKTIVLSTRNAHKVQEIRALLSDDFDYRTLEDLPGAPRVMEDAGTFAGNAAKKAVQLAEWIAHREISNLKFEISNSMVLADDSGLEVDALNGDPGVHSARFAAMDEGSADNSPDTANNAKLLRLLKDVLLEKRTARFRCVIALAIIPPVNATELRRPERWARDEIQAELFEGACEGRIGFAPKGDAGFGYDPLFIPDGHQETFAELGEGTKNQISHRAKALMKLRRRLIDSDDHSGFVQVIGN